MTFKSITGITVNNPKVCIKGISSFACICNKCQKEFYQLINNNMTNKTRVRKVPKTIRTIKVPIKTFTEKTSTYFIDEIYQSQKTDKFLDKAFWITCAILVVLAITLIIVNK